MMHDKPKHDASFPTGYEQAWLYRLYHAIGWERVERFEVHRSPTGCMAHLHDLKAEGSGIYDFKSATEDPFQYEVTLKKWEQRSGYTTQATMVVTAVPSVYDTNTTVLTCRAYPTMGEFVQLLFIGLWTGSLILLTLVTEDSPGRQKTICIIPIGLFGLVAAWLLRFYQRNRLVGLVTQHFAALQKKDRAAAQKPDTEESWTIETRPMLYDPARRDHQ